MAELSDEEAKQFGTDVKAARVKQGWLQKELAFRAFGNEDRGTHVSAIEKGTFGRKLTQRVAKQVGEALGLPPSVVPETLLWTEARLQLGQKQSAAEAEEAKAELRLVTKYLEKRIADLMAAVAEYAAKLETNQRTVLALAERYAEGTHDSYDAAVAGLICALEVAHDERERGRLPLNLAYAIDAIIEQVDALNEAGDLDAGATAIENGLASMAAEEEVLTQKRREDDKLSRSRRIRLYDKGIAQAVLTRDAETATRYILGKIGLDHPSGTCANQNAVRSERLARLQRGCDKGLTFDLKVSAALSRHLISIPQDAIGMGYEFDALGVSLRELGERQTGVILLKEAESYQRKALAIFIDTGNHAQAMRTRHNLGTTLTAIGRSKNNTAYLQDAVVELQSVIAYFQTENSLFEWAMAQNNLGNALQRIGGHNTDNKYIEAAVAAYNAALTVWSVDLDVKNWAGCLNNLSLCLFRLGRRLKSTSTIKQARDLAEKGRSEIPRAKFPFLWAITTGNLALSLSELTEYKDDRETVYDAMNLFDDALDEVTRERHPLLWADLQVGLGNTHTTIGKLGNAKHHFEAAKTAYKAALQVQTADDTPENWKLTVRRLAGLYYIWASQEKGSVKRDLQMLAVKSIDMELAATSPDAASIYSTLISELKKVILREMKEG
ncbi:MAG: hypothetical protein AAF580_09735 [Pseudomonadota bacterium]